MCDYSTNRDRDRDGKRTGVVQRKLEEGALRAGREFIGIEPQNVAVLASILLDINLPPITIQSVHFVNGSRNPLGNKLFWVSERHGVSSGSVDPP